MTTSPIDKLDIHHRQQLSAMMDGALSPDEARFLLRRLQHDQELGGCWDRWLVCGEVLRGRAEVPAPAGFAERVALVVASEKNQIPAHAQANSSRGRLSRWTGGALAASVALVALFMARPQTSPDAVSPASPGIAAQTSMLAEAIVSSHAETGNAAKDALNQTVASAGAAGVAVASLPRRQEASSRGSATRTQQAARRAPRAATPQRAVASAVTTPVLAPTDPFSTKQLATPQSRPWPRAALPQVSAGGAFTADYSSQGAAQTFYPFEPRLPAATTVESSDNPPQD